jgi:L-threonylcarbamoyladenylate synthase
MRIIKKNKKNLKEIVSALLNGAVLVCPTDTVYGFLADATNKKSVDKIYKIKKRPKTKPLPVFVADLKMAKDLAEINDKQNKMLKTRWPGKYTFVLNRTTQRVPRSKLYGVDNKTIALRIPKYKFLNDLLNKINKPLVQTSVNISGKPTLNRVEDIVKTFENSKIKPDFIIDGNLSRRQSRRGSSVSPGNKSKPSVIIDLTQENIKILRK